MDRDGRLLDFELANRNSYVDRFNVRVLCACVYTRVVGRITNSVRKRQRRVIIFYTLYVCTRACTVRPKVSAGPGK